MKLNNVMVNANAVIEASKILKNNPSLARKLMNARNVEMDAPVHDIEMIEGIPSWNDARIVADDFISEGARINILTDPDGTYKVLADFGQIDKAG